MLTGCQFRHHPAKQGVHIGLACQNLCGKATVIHQRKRRFVTGSFNAKTKH